PHRAPALLPPAASTPRRPLPPRLPRRRTPSPPPLPPASMQTLYGTHSAPPPHSHTLHPNSPPPRSPPQRAGNPPPPRPRHPPAAATHKADPRPPQRAAPAIRRNRIGSCAARRAGSPAGDEEAPTRLRRRRRECDAPWGALLEAARECPER